MDELKNIVALMGKRTDLVGGLLSVLERKVKASEKELLKSVIEGFVDKLELTADGKVKNTLYNKRLLGSIDTIFDKFGKIEGVGIAKTIADGVQSVVNFSGEYYKMFTTKAKLLTIKPAVMETMAGWLGLTDTGKVDPNGYLNTLIKDTTVKNQVKNMTLRAVVGQQGWRETKEQLATFIQGNADKTGSLTKYYRNFVYDTYSQVDRATTQIYANKLGFKFFIYEGGLIETSRFFCIEKNGKVFHESEIQLFDPPTAKPPNYNPFTDCGGYGCRHHLNGIPDALAYAMRPEAKILFGNAAAAPVKAAPVPKKVEPPKPAPVKVEKPKAQAPAQQIPKPANSVYDTITTRATAKKVMEDIVAPFGYRGAPVNISMSTALSVEDLKAYVKQVGTLFSDYKITAPYIKEISFKSKSGAYGYVESYAVDHGIKTANFGDRVDPSRSTVYAGASERISKQGKSRVDAANVRISTATHEFAHVIAGSTSTDVSSYGFFQEMKALRAEYHKEVNDLVRRGAVKGAAEIYLGKYAGTNVDEFWAEAFTEYKLSKKPSKYAKLAGKIGDKYFKK